MQSFREFLLENYEMTLEEYETLNPYRKGIIWGEFEEHVKHYIG